MTRSPHRIVGTWPRAMAISSVLVAVATAGCLGSFGASEAPAVHTPATAGGATSAEPGPSLAVSATPATSAPASPRTTTESSAPPAAFLAGPTGGPVAGELGSFSWDGLVSDSPWIVPKTVSRVDPARRLRVRFVGGPPVAAWTARWARASNGDAGEPRIAGSGVGTPLAVDSPPGRGGWSLQVDVRFDGGGRAAWYWRVRVDR